MGNPAVHVVHVHVYHYCTLHVHVHVCTVATIVFLRETLKLKMEISDFQIESNEIRETF